MDIQIKRAIAAMEVTAIVLLVLLLPLSSLDPPTQRKALLVGIIVCAPLLWRLFADARGSEWLETILIRSRCARRRLPVSWWPWSATWPATGSPGSASNICYWVSVYRLRDFDHSLHCV